MKSFGKKAWLLPQPVLIIGTYSENGVANAMNAAWAGQWDAHEIMISMGSHATTEKLNRCGEFTVTFATKATMVAADYVGIVSAKNEPNKMEKTGWTAVKAENVEFYNLRGGKERIFDEMNNGFGWNRLPKSFMAQNTVFMLMTALIRNFYKAIMRRLDTKEFGLRINSRIKTFVFKFISVPAKWIKTSRQHVLNIYTENQAYANLFQTDFG